MAKVLERNKAISLRENGHSIKDIARSLKIAKSTVSLWCRDIKLTQKQINRLHNKMITGGYPGRMKGARMQYERRLNRIKELEKEGEKKIGYLSKRDLLITLISLYWGEGSKKSRQVSINNSDPEMINLLIVAFRKLFNLDEKRFRLSVFINKIHKEREKEIKNYWSKNTKIPENQFTKTIFIKVKNKKNYNNFQTHYGTLRIRITKSTDICYSILGLIKALAKIKPV